MSAAGGRAGSAVAWAAVGDAACDGLDDELYDELTRRRIERAGAGARGAAGGGAGPVKVRRRRASATQRAVGGAALLAAVARGLQEVFDPADEAPIVAVDRDPGDVWEPAVTLLLVPDAPHQSRALVRPWLL